jgi:TRAP-type mannitol/chloroaromatic compound transport system substrate-binding protein
VRASGPTANDKQTGAIFMKSGLLRGCAVLAAAGALALSAASAHAERITWKLASAFPKSNVLIGSWGHKVSEDVEAITDGQFRLRWYEPNALVPPLELLDAVGKGSIEAAFQSPGFNAGKLPIAALFSSIPFGPDAVQQFAWLTEGGGNELYNKYLAEFNVHSIPCGMIGGQGMGWFRNELTSLDDLKGLKMRFFGYGARVMEKLGVSTQLLAGGDVYPALELGTIDAAEYSTPINDEEAGLHQVASYYYFPSWHEPFSFSAIIVNLDKWNALSDGYKRLLEMACNAITLEEVAKSNVIQGPVLKRFEEKGVTVTTIPEEIVQAAHEAWGEVVAEESQKDPNFKEAWESLQAFQERYAAFAGLAYAYEEMIGE